MKIWSWLGSQKRLRGGLLDHGICSEVFSLNVVCFFKKNTSVVAERLFLRLSGINVVSPSALCLAQVVFKVAPVSLFHAHRCYWTQNDLSAEHASHSHINHVQLRQCCAPMWSTHLPVNRRVKIHFNFSFFYLSYNKKKKCNFALFVQFMPWFNSSLSSDLPIHLPLQKKWRTNVKTYDTFIHKKIITLYITVKTVILWNYSITI